MQADQLDMRTRPDVHGTTVCPTETEDDPFDGIDDIDAEPSEHQAQERTTAIITPSFTRDSEQLFHLKNEILQHPLNSNAFVQTPKTEQNMSPDSCHPGDHDFESGHEDSGSETLAESFHCWAGTSLNSNASKRFQPSPTPSSSNASVIASEEEEEGFADVEFPAETGNLKFVGVGAQPSHIDSCGALDELNEKISRYADAARDFDGGFDDAEEDDALSGFSMPEDFSWKKQVLPTRLDPPCSTDAVSSSVFSTSTHAPIVSHQAASVSGRSSVIMARPVKQFDFGDGTELDDLDDISDSSSCIEPCSAPINPAPLRAWIESSPPKLTPVLAFNPTAFKPSINSSLAQKANVPAVKQDTARKLATANRPAVLSGMLGSSHRRSDPNLARWAKPAPSQANSQKKQKKKPTLIRNVNPADIAHVIGTMKYDPFLQKWTGNEEALLDFEKDASSVANTNTSVGLALKPKTRPALIKNKSGMSQTVHTVGAMVFDPVKMCWTGNEDEMDVFSGIEDDGFLKSVDEQDNQKYFILTKTKKQSLYLAESSHKLFIGRWYPKAVQESRTLVRDTSKSHLYDVRMFTMRH
ncbi:hypothetical protein BJ741DRAFT_663858 [Chytriomyces cf. hyalinus JEL632]|nr:hypothetical protein BJ741DRAFT_663858 [Chytriomyces cf. hyalinus JEL632]